MSSWMRAPPLSAIAPMSGAISATMTLAMPFARPRRNVLSVASTPAFQNCLKYSGKNPAITVVANAEFAQSHSAQADHRPPQQARRERWHRAELPGQRPGHERFAELSGHQLADSRVSLNLQVRPAFQRQRQVHARRREIHELARHDRPRDSRTPWCGTLRACARRRSPSAQ